MLRHRWCCRFAAHKLTTQFSSILAAFPGKNYELGASVQSAVSLFLTFLILCVHIHHILSFTKSPFFFLFYEKFAFFMENTKSFVQQLTTLCLRNCQTGKGHTHIHRAMYQKRDGKWGSCYSCHSGVAGPYFYLPSLLLSPHSHPHSFLCFLFLFSFFFFYITLHLGKFNNVDSTSNFNFKLAW